MRNSSFWHCQRWPGMHLVQLFLRLVESLWHAISRIVYSLRLQCPCPPTGPYTAISRKYDFNCFGPSQKVCYKSGLKIVFKWPTPFKQHFGIIFIACLLGRPKTIRIAFGHIALQGDMDSIAIDKHTLSAPK